MRKKVSILISALTAGLTAIGCGMLPQNPGATNAAETDKKLIALTFDDGPNTTTTNDVLDVLAEYDARASFFLIGDNINSASAASVKRAYDMGMEIDNHSKTHSNMSKMTAAEMQAEIEFVDEKVMEITGGHTRFFRPPFIDVSAAMYEAIGLPFICGIDCQDYMANVTAQERADYILNGAKDGVIVLLHDAAGNQQTVEALKIAMPELVRQGYEFVTLTELFERQGETPKKNILYSNVAKYPQGYAPKETVAEDASDRIALDPMLLGSLGKNYAVETEYDSATGYPPVIALQKWSGTPTIWHTIQPYYFNGQKAVYLAEDIQSALDQLEVGLNDLDGVLLTAYSGEITLRNVRILTKTDSEDPAETVKGDVNADGVCDIADAVLMHKSLLSVPDAKLADWKAGDLNADGKLNSADLSLIKKLLMQ